MRNSSPHFFISRTRKTRETKKKVLRIFDVDFLSYFFIRFMGSCLKLVDVSENRLMIAVGNKYLDNCQIRCYAQRSFSFSANSMFA